MKQDKIEPGSSLLKNALFNMGYRLMDALFPLVSVAYIARTLSPAGVGSVAFAQNIVSYFVMFAAMGIPTYGTREIAVCREDPQKRDAVFSELIFLNGIATLFCAAIYYGGIALLRPEDTLLHCIMGLCILLNLINIDWLYQGEEDYVYITLRSFIVKLVMLMALFCFVKTEADYLIYGLIQCLGVGGNYIFNVFHARKRVRLVMRGLNIRRHMKPVMLLLLSGLVGAVYARCDVTVLGAITSDAEVGYYTSAQKVITVVITMITASTAVFLPRLSNVIRRDMQQFQWYLRCGTWLVLWLAIPAFMGLLLVSEDLTRFLFTDAYLPMVDTLKILSLLVLIRGLGDLLCYQAVISSGREKELIFPRVIASLVSVLLLTVLIPRLGINGAAIALIVSETLVNGMILIRQRDLLRFAVAWKDLMGILLACGAMAATVVAIQLALPWGAARFVLSVAAGVVVYLILSVLLRVEPVRILKQMSPGRRKNNLPPPCSD